MRLQQGRFPLTPTKYHRPSPTNLSELASACSVDLDCPMFASDFFLPGNAFHVWSHRSGGVLPAEAKGRKLADIAIADRFDPVSGSSPLASI